MKKILVVCTGNSCRSQMAEGYLKYFANEKAMVYSAGLEAHGLNKLAVASMLEDGIDISQHTSNTIEQYSHLNFDFIITVCDHANEHCPVINASALRFHQNFTDPSKFEGSAEATNIQFGLTRERIKLYCKQFFENNLCESI